MHVFYLPQDSLIYICAGCVWVCICGQMSVKHAVALSVQLHVCLYQSKCTRVHVHTSCIRMCVSVCVGLCFIWDPLSYMCEQNMHAGGCPTQPVEVWLSGCPEAVFLGWEIQVENRCPVAACLTPLSLSNSVHCQSLSAEA